MATRQLPLPTDRNPARLGWPALKPSQTKPNKQCPPMQVARAQKAARKSDVPDTQPGRKRKLVPGQVFVPGMGGDLSFSDALVDPVSV